VDGYPKMTGINRSPLGAGPVSARVIRLPKTPAGRELLREAAVMIGGWGKPGGAVLEDFDWDASAAEDKRLLGSAPARGMR
jgi:hypothetical protein